MAEEIQVVEFELGDRLFATEIENVREIVEKSEVRDLPNTPDCVEGVINLRGETATLLNPTVMLDVEDFSEEGRILVIESEQDTTGVLVDAVNEVYKVPEDGLQDTSKLDEDELSTAVYRKQNEDDEENEADEGFVVLVDLSKMEDRVKEMTRASG